MEIMRIACIDPPTSDRSKWARDLLLQALAQDLAPIPVPVSKTETFTISVRHDLEASVKKIASARGWSVPETAAGLIHAVRLHQQASTSTSVGQQHADDDDDDDELSWIRPEIRPLAREINKAIEGEKIAFAEAATGVGKGRLIAHLAIQAASQGKRVVITAPLPIAWQLADTICDAPGFPGHGVALLLGRANFVCPELLNTWALENENESVLAWIADGGPARSPIAQKLQERLGINLNWLLEDALELSDELPVSSVMLASDDAEDTANLGEQVYQALQLSGREADILICSHHLLAAHVKTQQITDGRKSAQGAVAKKPSKSLSLLDQPIDLLLVDEAHKLEEAFAAIFSQALHMRPFERLLEHSSIVRKKDLLQHAQALSSAILTYTQQDGSFTSRTGTLDAFPLVGWRSKELLKALDGVKVKKNSEAVAAINHTRRALNSVGSGFGTIRLDVSPVRYYPQLLIGSPSLNNPFERLWSQVAAGVLVSATLYTDGVNAGLTRWKLGVPKPRASFLAPVIPKWVIDPVLMHLPNRDDIAPDDSKAWLESVAGKIQTIAADARGGTLVLCTSYANLGDIAALLKTSIGERLIVQSTTQGASACANRFRAAYNEGIRPVWLGVGSAWTGIDLSDSDAPAEQDNMLTDLVITRLPLGVNRTLTHERRTSVSGFSIVVQEAVWHMRQGIGRLVRRPGVPQRNLWMLDQRLVGTETWPAGFRQALKRYRVEGKR